MKKIVLILFLFQFSFPSFGSISDSVRIYLLTYTPGNELYSTFGHSSIRVINETSGTDKVYNYGTFNFETKNFYFKFFKGKLNYSLSKVNTDIVLKTTVLEKRSILQNELMLLPGEKRKLLKALETNYLPENREYRYDFLYDNCATRIYWLIDSITEGKYKSNLAYNNPRFNILVNEYLNQHPAAKLGFNLIAGKQILKKTEAIESLFLPDYLKYYLSSLSYNNKDLIGPDQILVHNASQNQNESWLNWIMILLLVIGILIRRVELSTKKTYDLWSVFVLIIPSIFVLFSTLFWLISDHQIYAWNINLLWAVPSLILVMLNKRKNKWRFLLFLPIGIGVVGVIFFLGVSIPILVIIFLVLSRVKRYSRL